ncbi:MAG: hypothetical protein KC561_11185, partial [Myxococcales bacterium]|nr:hypothetical protein [Myxococcales bacterium]
MSRFRLTGSVLAASVLSILPLGASAVGPPQLGQPTEPVLPLYLHSEIAQSAGQRLVYWPWDNAFDEEFRFERGDNEIPIPENGSIHEGTYIATQEGYLEIASDTVLLDADRIAAVYGTIAVLTTDDEIYLYDYTDGSRIQLPHPGGDWPISEIKFGSANYHLWASIPAVPDNAVDGLGPHSRIIYYDEGSGEWIGDESGEFPNAPVSTDGEFARFSWGPSVGNDNQTQGHLLGTVVSLGPDPDAVWPDPAADGVYYMRMFSTDSNGGSFSDLGCYWNDRVHFGEVADVALKARWGDGFLLMAYPGADEISDFSGIQFTEWSSPCTDQDSGQFYNFTSGMNGPQSVYVFEDFFEGSQTMVQQANGAIQMHTTWQVSNAEQWHTLIPGNITPPGPMTLDAGTTDIYLVDTENGSLRYYPFRQTLILSSDSTQGLN